MAEIGYDTCPMEGSDTSRVKKILNLPRKAEINMIIGCGIRAENGVYSDRFRVPFDDVYKKIQVNVGVKNIKPADLADILFTKYGIFTVPIDYANVKGCRITPNIYTNEQELDYFVDSIFKIASN